MLIDEAEMLLERRTKSEILRNAMVCVMLRLLEYYRGILFLTTNRVESLDPAFQSRVTCALKYPPLGVDSRAKIWADVLAHAGVDVTCAPSAPAPVGSGGALAEFARGAPPGDVGPERAPGLELAPGLALAPDRDRDIDLGALAAHDLNGRQIKNALQLALALSRREGSPLSMRHLDATLEITAAFIEETRSLE